MSDAADGDHMEIVVNDIYDSIVADAPKVFVTSQFPAPERSWVIGESVNFGHHPRNEAVAQLLEFLPA